MGLNYCGLFTLLLIKSTIKPPNNKRLLQFLHESSENRMLAESLFVSSAPLMETGTLELFIDVMQHRSFATVARQRNVDPSSVSRAIAKLEAELGIQLFQRTTRKLAPTEAGALYFEQIVPLVDALDSACQMALDVSQSPRGTLRVTASSVFANIQIVPFLPEFARQYPDLRVELILTDAYLDLIAERIDVAVRLGTLKDSSYQCRHIRNMEFFICASPEYLAQHGQPNTPEEIAAHQCLLFPRGAHRLDWQFKDADGRITRVPIQGQYLLTQSMAIRQCAIAHMGLALLPDWLIQTDIEAGHLVRLFEHYDVTATDYTSAIWFLYPPHQYLPLKTKVFMDYLRRELVNTELM